MKKTLAFIIALMSVTLSLALMPFVFVFVIMSAIVDLLVLPGDEDDSDANLQASQGAWVLRPMYYHDELVGYRVGWTVPMSNGKLLWVSTHEVSDEVDIEECRLRAIADLIHVTDSKHTPATYHMHALDQSK